MLFSISIQLQLVFEIVWNNFRMKKKLTGKFICSDLYLRCCLFVRVRPVAAPFGSGLLHDHLPLHQHVCPHRPAVVAVCRHFPCTIHNRWTWKTRAQCRLDSYTGQQQRRRWSHPSRAHSLCHSDVSAF